MSFVVKNLDRLVLITRGEEGRKRGILPRITLTFKYAPQTEQWNVKPFKEGTAKINLGIQQIKCVSRNITIHIVYDIYHYQAKNF